MKPVALLAAVLAKKPLLIQRGEIFDSPSKREPLAHPGFTSSGQLTGILWVAKEPNNCLSQAIWIARFDQESGLLMNNSVDQATDARGDSGATHEERFDRSSKILAQTSLNGDVCCSEDVVYIGAVARKDHRLLKI